MNKKILRNNFEKILKVKKQKTDKDLKNEERRLKRKRINKLKENGRITKYACL